jgi:hypothetical protein
VSAGDGPGLVCVLGVESVPHGHMRGLPWPAGLRLAPGEKNLTPWLQFNYSANSPRAILETTVSKVTERMRWRPGWTSPDTSPQEPSEVVLSGRTLPLTLLPKWFYKHFKSKAKPSWNARWNPGSACVFPRLLVVPFVIS